MKVYVINNINESLRALEINIEKIKRNELLEKIGFLCFKLFDYPKVIDDKTKRPECFYYRAHP